MNLSARFTQAPAEKKRYLLDWTLDLAAGETITNIAVSITSSTDIPNVGAFTISSVAIAPGSLQATFFATGGLDLGIYAVKFHATTSITQLLDTVVEFTVKDKLDA